VWATFWQYGTERNVNQPVLFERNLVVSVKVGHLSTWTFFCLNKEMLKLEFLPNKIHSSLYGKNGKIKVRLIMHVVTYTL